MSHETEILGDLLSMPTKARAALLVSAIDALQRTTTADLIEGTRRQFPDIARPQLMQQVLLALMAHLRAEVPNAPRALHPAACRSSQALSCHLYEEPTSRVDPFALGLWGLIESLFPDDEDVVPGHSPM